MAGLSALQAQSTAHSRAAVVLAAAVERDVAASGMVDFNRCGTLLV